MIRRILRNQYLYSVFTKLMTAFLGVLNMVFINRLLGPALRGEYIYILNIANLVTMFLNLGIYQSYPLFKRRDIPELQTKYINNVFLQLIVYLIVSGILCGIFKNKWQLIIIFTLIPFMIINKQVNFIVMVEDINLRNRINIYMEAIYSLCLFIIFCTAWQNIYIILSLMYLKSVLQLLFVIILFKIKINFRLIDLKLLVQSIGVGFVSMLSLLMITLNYRVDVIILKLFTDYKQIGLYSVGAALAEQGWLISDAFKEVLFSKNARKDDIEDICMCIKINVVITVLMFAGIAVLGKPVLFILFGREFTEAYPVTIILFSGILGMVLYKMVYPLFIATGRQGISLAVLSASTAANVIFNFLLIPPFGIQGSAASSVISYNICGIFFISIFCRKYNLKLMDTILPSIKDLKNIKRKIAVRLGKNEHEFNY
ncbi:polysaccharide biosynthesis C-terminal domain-containing protein [Ruminiclostridium sufflavum]|nr:polysaccharide biosynthesis C-terminal domain-containing protein [Ruminiclostridium sufflavum]